MVAPAHRRKIVMAIVEIKGANAMVMAVIVKKKVTAYLSAIAIV